MTTHVIIKALARDVLSALFRATDERSQNSLTFCTLSALLNDVSAREAIENYIRSEAPDWQVESSVRESAKCTEQLLLLVPPTWKKPPQDTSLLKLRAKLKPVRDSLLSHSLDYANVQQPTFDETREFLRIVNELQRCASRVLYASTDPLQTRWDVALREGHRFWDVVEIGVSENLADPRLGP
ncbi:MAG: hypothetical protein GC206_05305 [Alphaproteobacteria bacterium]|nr:hypothetical protein [Alphaproteobacteria bacterium]